MDSLISFINISQVLIVVDMNKNKDLYRCRGTEGKKKRINTDKDCNGF